MNIEVTITHKLSPAIEQILTTLANAATQSLGQEDGRDAPPAPKAPRARKAAAPEAPSVAAPYVATPPATPLPQLVPAAKVPGAGPTIEDVAKMVAATMERIGVPAMRAVFKKFPGVGRVLDLKQEQLPAFCAALQEAEQMVATS